MRLTYKAVYRLEPDGQWLVDVPQVPGCSARAKTFQEARVRIREALARTVGAGTLPEVVDEILRR